MRAEIHSGRRTKLIKPAPATSALAMTSLAGRDWIRIWAICGGAMRAARARRRARLVA